MGRERYLKVKPKQKCPKDHKVFHDAYLDNRWLGKNVYYCDEEDLCYLRTGERAHIKETPTTEKIRNLFLLADFAEGDPDYVSPEEFCELRDISLSNYRRLLTILREHYGICSEDGNTYEDTPANRKYLALLALYERLEDGVEKDAFCAEFRIGRTTFFRYLALVEDFYFYLYEGKKRIALLGNGNYLGVHMEDLEEYNKWEDEQRKWRREERLKRKRKSPELSEGEGDEGNEGNEDGNAPTNGEA